MMLLSIPASRAAPGGGVHHAPHSNQPVGSLRVSTREREIENARRGCGSSCCARIDPSAGAPPREHMALWGRNCRPAPAGTQRRGGSINQRAIAICVLCAIAAANNQRRTRARSRGQLTPSRPSRVTVRVRAPGFCGWRDMDFFSCH
jgi:hypothetical protein